MADEATVTVGGPSAGTYTLEVGCNYSRGNQSFTFSAFPPVGVETGPSVLNIGLGTFPRENVPLASGTYTGHFEYNDFQGNGGRVDADVTLSVREPGNFPVVELSASTDIEEAGVSLQVTARCTTIVMG